MEITHARYHPRRPEKRPRRFKRLFAIVASLTLVLSASGYSILALSKTVPAVAAEKLAVTTNLPTETVSLNWPSSGQAAIGSLEDGVLATTDNERQRPIASMTKAITALVILEKQPLSIGEQGQTYTIDQVDIDNYHRYLSQGGSVMGIVPGQALSQYQALEGMLLPSANNIADSLVVWTFGSLDAYLQYANNLLNEWGLKDTAVADASGFDSGSKSTPSDMIHIGKRLMENPVLTEIVSKKQAFIPGTGTIMNTNALLYEEGAVGIKTGRTDEAGSCLLFAMKHGPEKSHTLIGVLMGQPNYFGMFSTAHTLANSAFKGFGQIDVLPAGTVVGKLTTPWGDSTDIVNVQPLKTFGWLGRTYGSTVALDAVEAPVLKNQIVGTASLVSGQANVQLMAQEQISRPSTWWRLFN